MTRNKTYNNKKLLGELSERDLSYLKWLDAWRQGEDTGKAFNESLLDPKIIMAYSEDPKEICAACKKLDDWLPIQCIACEYGAEA